MPDVCSSSGRTWKSPSVSSRRRGGAGPAPLAAPRPPPSTPVTWRLAPDQVQRKAVPLSAVSALHRLADDRNNRYQNDDACEKSMRIYCPPALSLTLYDLCPSVIPEGQRFSPTSPLRDDSGPPGRRRRSQSASVRFKDAGLSADDVRTETSRVPAMQCQQVATRGQPGSGALM